MLASISLLHLLAIAVATLVAFDFARWQFAEPAPQYASLAVAGLLLLGTQHLARGIATARPERAALLLYRPLSIFGLISRPLMAPWLALTNLLLRKLFGVEDRAATSEEDMRTLIDVVEETAALEEGERDMITSIFDLSDRDVREIMVGRADIVAIPSAATVSEAVDVLVSSGHSRVPVFDGDLDHVTGMLHLRDLAQAIRAGRGGATVSQFLRPVHVVPETKKIDELLREFQEQRIQMAVIGDEYGGVAGVVTIEDLLEEIVGEIRDEYDTEEEEPIQRLSATEVLLDSRVSIHDAAEVLPISTDYAEYDTIGRLVFERLDKVPEIGDWIQLERCRIKVIATKGRRIQKVLATISAPGEGAGAPAQSA
jgi:CBS domain containing-hemolysin-like protein